MSFTQQPYQAVIDLERCDYPGPISVSMTCRGHHAVARVEALIQCAASSSTASDVMMSPGSKLTRRAPNQLDSHEPWSGTVQSSRISRLGAICRIRRGLRGSMGSCDEALHPVTGSPLRPNNTVTQTQTQTTQAHLRTFLTFPYTVPGASIFRPVLAIDFELPGCKALSAARPVAGRNAWP